MKVRPVIGAIACITTALLLALGILSLPPAASASIPDAAAIPLPALDASLQAAPRTCRDIQLAINALPAKGGEVLLAARVYSCPRPIVIRRDNVHLRGRGASTVLFLADNANAPVLVIGDSRTPPPRTVRNVMVSDLLIDGNREHQQHECWGGPCGDGGRPIRNNGITVRRAEDVLIERVMVKSARSGGLVTEKGCRRVTVRDLTSYDNAFDGLAAYETEDSIFTGLHLHHNRYAGLSFDLGFNGNVLSDIIIADSGKVGVFMRDSRDNVFQGMHVRNSQEHGIFLAEADGDPARAAVGNTFHAVTVSSSAGDGLRINDQSCRYNAAIGCQFVDNSGECVHSAARMLQAGNICR